MRRQAFNTEAGSRRSTDLIRGPFQTFQLFQPFQRLAAVQQWMSRYGPNGGSIQQFKGSLDLEPMPVQLCQPFKVQRPPAPPPPFET